MNGNRSIFSGGFAAVNLVLWLIGLSLVLMACSAQSSDAPREAVEPTPSVAPISKPAPTSVNAPLFSPLSTPEQSAFVSPLSLPGNFSGVLAFHSDESGALEVHTLDLESGVERQLVNEGRSFEPSWSPDCQHIVFVLEHNDSDNFELFVMNQDGSDQHKLITDQVLGTGMKDWSPAWSPAGDVIAYQTNRYGDLRVCFVSADGTDLGCTEFGWDTALPAWSPSGDRLIFIGLEDGDWDVLIAGAQNVNGKMILSEPVKLTNNTTVEKTPHMSPDGQYIVFESNDRDNYDIMLMRSDGTDLRRLTIGGVDEVMPSWLGNEQVLYARQIAAGWEIVTVEVNSGETRTIKNSDALNKWPMWCGLP